MTVKEWRRRINIASQAVRNGDTGPIVELCELIVAMESAAELSASYRDELAAVTAELKKLTPPPVPEGLQ
jgi:hypothetical protein